jgi:hypothetical protein
MGSTRHTVRLLSAFASVHAGCYSVDRLTVPTPEPVIVGPYITLMGLADDDAILVYTSSSTASVVFGTYADGDLPVWYPTDLSVVAIQFGSARLRNAYGEIVNPRSVRIGRTSACNDVCDGYVDNFRVKSGRVCNKFWEGTPTDDSPFQFYDWVDGVWTRRVGTLASPVNVDDIRCRISLELKN